MINKPSQSHFFLHKHKHFLIGCLSIVIVTRICAQLDIYSAKINISALWWTNYGTETLVQTYL